uniref:Uncharacterized protein n=1 Tax=Rhizophora mucronata TaxID=61149 RepID=A0A2P2JF88_RHIMU
MDFLSNAFALLDLDAAEDDQVNAAAAPSVSAFSSSAKATTSAQNKGLSRLCFSFFLLNSLEKA